MPRNPANSNIYMRPDFFQRIDTQFWENNGHTERTKEYFRAIVERDREICERKMKSDGTIWQLKTKRA